MTFTISVADAGVAFDCEPEQNVLDAAETAGWAIPYSCRKGICDSCVGSLTTGELEVPGEGNVCGPATGSPVTAGRAGNCGFGVVPIAVRPSW